MAVYIIADNQELTGLALEHLLGLDESNILFHARDKASLLALLMKQEHAVVLLDYTLFDFPDEESLLIMSERFAQVSWLLISDELTTQFLRKITYSSHSFSVVFKDLKVNELRTAITYASEGRRYICQRATEMMLTHQQEEERRNVLTPTEIEIAKAIAQGKTTKEVAAERFLSVHTVTTHRKNIFRKMGVNTAHEMIKYAIRAGWVDPADFYI